MGYIVEHHVQLNPRGDQSLMSGSHSEAYVRSRLVSSPAARSAGKGIHGTTTFDLWIPFPGCCAARRG
ncbi:hypothetical protein CHELA40_50180 [Chelatococcus asaccharovorans]|nr:hypothetical protein CHELA17_20144 [Chelatococcus asaccharovorans]CAH1691592.1 hypothetical protein CHELA40_50180 [Chelatococcus asaccharovorans]